MLTQHVHSCARTAALELAPLQIVGSPTNDTLVGFDKGSGAGNETSGSWFSPLEDDQGLEFEK